MMFAECLYHPACPGEPNDALVSKYAYPNQTLRTNQSFCDEELGHKSICVENSTNVPCRLCATCKEGYKRVGSSTECQKCPPPDENRAWLAVGFFVMILGTSILIYLAITSEVSQDETSDTVKKIILKFLQILSLAGSLPMRWPQALLNMFKSFETMSSAGTTLLVPDCELSHLDAAEAFFDKQKFYTILLPMVVVACVVVWFFLWCACKKIKHHKDYMVLSIVLLSFLLYPTLVKLTLSVSVFLWSVFVLLMIVFVYTDMLPFDFPLLMYHFRCSAASASAMMPT
jgi:hypothetical protein